MDRPTVLLVEDNEMEEILAKRAITRSEVDCEILVARDGVEACHILYESVMPLPDLVLLDLKMPRMNGFEVLERIRSIYSTSRLPVIILSSSDDQGDIQRCLDLHANSYLRKTFDLDTYESQIKLLLYYWLAVNVKVA